MIDIEELKRKCSLADGNTSLHSPHILTNTVVLTWTPNLSFPKLFNDQLMKSIALQPSNEIKLTSNSDLI